MVEWGVGSGVGDFSEPGMEWTDESDEDEYEEAEDGMKGSHIRPVGWGLGIDGGGVRP